MSEANRLVRIESYFVVQSQRFTFYAFWREAGGLRR